MALLERQTEPIKIKDFISRLNGALDHLAKSACDSLSERKDNSELWALAFKRRLVQFDGRVPMVGKREMNFVEVVNIAATAKRLLDVLLWASGELGDCKVVCCNPSHTSGGHDLEIEYGNNGARAIFEVSDVVKGRDSNSKEQKDLISLGARVDPKRVPPGLRAVPPSVKRRFLVTSKELGEKISRRGDQQKYTADGPRILPSPSREHATWIFELR